LEKILRSNEGEKRKRNNEEALFYADQVQGIPKYAESEESIVFIPISIIIPIRKWKTHIM
jgi:hypothetical protein